MSFDIWCAIAHYFTHHDTIFAQRAQRLPHDARQTKVPDLDLALRTHDPGSSSKYLASMRVRAHTCKHDILGRDKKISWAGTKSARVSHLFRSLAHDQDIARLQVPVHDPVLHAMPASYEKSSDSD